MTEKEPWRIDKDSVYSRVLKGWLPERFKSWLSITAEQYKLSEDELLIRIIETIRKITWKTFQILEKKTNRNLFRIFRKRKMQEVDIPYVIISDNPRGDLAGFRWAIEKKDTSPNFYCSKAKVEKGLFRFAKQLILTEELIQRYRHKNGKAVIGGSTNENGIAIYDWAIIELFKYFNTLTKSNFWETVIEESFHYFSFRTGRFRHKELMQELRKADSFDGQEIEEKYGVKRMANKLSRILKQDEEDLFSLLPCAK